MLELKVLGMEYLARLRSKFQERFIKVVSKKDLSSPNHQLNNTKAVCKMRQPQSVILHCEELNSSIANIQ